MEKQIEQRLVQGIKKAGGLCIKLTNVKGIPDRLILLDGRVVFCEVKDTGKKLREEQVLWQKKLISMGFDAVMVDSKEQVDNLIEYCKRGR